MTCDSRQVLVDLLSNLWPTVLSMPMADATQMIAVDLSVSWLHVSEFRERASGQTTIGPLGSICSVETCYPKQTLH